jgi:hypothetical protein
MTLNPLLFLQENRKHEQIEFLLAFSAAVADRGAGRRSDGKNRS